MPLTVIDAESLPESDVRPLVEPSASVPSVTLSVSVSVLLPAWASARVIASPLAGGEDERRILVDASWPTGRSRWAELRRRR